MQPTLGLRVLQGPIARQGRRNTMSKRVFISYATEDELYRRFLVGLARSDNSPVEFVDMYAKEPWNDTWKDRCRTKIKGCDAVVALIGAHSMSADGARWEMQCADEEHIPMLGVYVHPDHKEPLPPEIE